MPSLIRSAVKLPCEWYKAPYAACIVLYNTIITLSNHTQRSCTAVYQDGSLSRYVLWAFDRQGFN